MARKHKKSRRITPQNIGSKPLRMRTSRHGRPLMGPDTPFVKRWRTVEEVNGSLTVKHHERPMTVDEIQNERNSVKRALAPTQKHGRLNEMKGAKA